MFDAMIDNLSFLIFHLNIFSYLILVALLSFPQLIHFSVRLYRQQSLTLNKQKNSTFNCNVCPETFSEIGCFKN